MLFVCWTRWSNNADYWCYFVYIEQNYTEYPWLAYQYLVSFISHPPKQQGRTFPTNPNWQKNAKDWLWFYIGKYSSRQEMDFHSHWLLQQVHLFFSQDNFRSENVLIWQEPYLYMHVSYSIHWHICIHQCIYLYCHIVPSAHRFLKGLLGYRWYLLTALAIFFTEI